MGGSRCMKVNTGLNQKPASINGPGDSQPSRPQQPTFSGVHMQQLCLHALPNLQARERRKEDILSGQGWRVIEGEHANTQLNACLRAIHSCQPSTALPTPAHLQRAVMATSDPS